MEAIGTKAWTDTGDAACKTVDNLKCRNANGIQELIGTTNKNARLSSTDWLCKTYSTEKFCFTGTNFTWQAIGNKKWNGANDFLCKDMADGKCRKKDGDQYDVESVLSTGLAAIKVRTSVSDALCKVTADFDTGADNTAACAEAEKATGGSANSLI